MPTPPDGPALTDGLPSPTARDRAHAGEKAAVLAEALPWLQRFHGASSSSSTAATP